MTQDYGGKFLQDSLKDYIEEPLKKFISENPSFVGLLILIQTSLILILASVYFLLSGPSSFGKFGFDIGKALLISAFAGFVCTYFVAREKLFVKKSPSNNRKFCRFKR